MASQLHQLLAEDWGTPRKRAQKLPEEQQESMLSNALNAIGSGIGWVGETLDKTTGSRSLRGAALDERGAWDWGGASLSDLAHLIPFSDTLGLTDRGIFGTNLLASKNDVASATDFRRVNIMEDVDTGNPIRDALTNIAMDVGTGMALDPIGMSLTGPGKALTATGKAASKAGKLLGTSPRALIDEIGAGQRGLLGLKVPFAESNFATIGAGGGLIDKLLGPIGGTQAIASAAYYNPVTRAVRDVFDTRVKGTFDKAGQRAADLRYSLTENSVSEILDTNLALSKKISGMEDEFNHTIKRYIDGNPEMAKRLTGTMTNTGDMKFDEFLRAIGEQKESIAGVGRMRAMAEEIDMLANTKTPESVMVAFDKVDGIVNEAISLKDRVKDAFVAAGGDVSILDDEFAAHMPRRIAAYLRKIMASDRDAEQAAEGVWGAIQRNIRDIPGATFGVQRISKDAEITAIAHGEAWQAMTKAQRNVVLEGNAAKLEQAYGLPGASQMTDPHTGVGLFDDAGAPLMERPAMEFAQHMAHMPVDVLQDGLFTREMLTDITDYSLNMSRKTNALLATRDLLMNSTSADAVGPTLAELFGKTGKMRRVKTKTGWKAVPEEGAVTMTDTGVEQFKLAWEAANPGKTLDMHNMRVPAVFEKTVQKFRDLHEQPWKAHGVIKAFDKGSAAWKSLVYHMPASYMRNLVSGIWQNMVTAFRNPAAGVKAMGQAVNALTRGTLDDDIRAFKAYGLLKGGHLEELFSDASAVKDIPSLKAMMGGFLSPLNPKKYKGWVDNPLNPLNQVGVREGVKSGEGFFMGAGGSHANEIVEFVNRYSHFKALKDRGWSNAAAARSTKLAHFDYGDMTQWEREGFKRLIPFYCVPEHSEALTRDGWKTWRQLEFGDELLTYSTGKDCLEWQPCLEVASFDHHQDLMVLENKRHRLEFTPEHRWPVRRKGGHVAHPYGEYDYPDKMEVVTGEQLNTNMAIVVTAEFKDNEESLLTPDQARLLGWIVTDGYHRHRGQHTEAMIYQHPKKFLEEVLRVAGGNPRNPHPDTGVICVPVLNERTKEIKPYLAHDGLVKVVTRLSRDAAEAMYDAMYKADGNTSKNHPNDFFAATKPGVREAFRILATMLGKRASESGRGCYVSHNRFLKIAGCTKKMERYDGVVWCPRTENGTWVMRQNGMITITGNTFTRKNLPAQLRNLIDEPGGRTAQTIRAMNVGRENVEDRNRDKYIPSFLGQGLAVPIGARKGSDQNYLISNNLLPVEEAFNRFPTFDGLPDVKNIAENIGSMMTPAANVPLQLMAGRQWWSHRNIGDLYQTPTNDENLNFLIANSPVSRYVSAERTIAQGTGENPRKTVEQILINLGIGGTRITTVDVPKWMQIEARDVIQRRLKPHADIREYSRLYSSDKESLSLDTRDELSMLNEILTSLRDMNKAKRESKVKQ